MFNYSKKELKQAEEIFHYLNMKSEPEVGDLIVGFGHFDMKIPHFCAELYRNNFAKIILFTGGVGAGSADLKQPDAKEFYDELNRKNFPISLNNILVEPFSTNTGENIIFAEKLLSERDNNFTFSKGIKKSLIVASPYRQRRVYLTCIMHFPEVKFINCPPTTTFEDEMELFESKKMNFVELLIGEIDRIENYQTMGYIASESIPAEIFKNYTLLRHKNFQ